jgi:hypothetical protein
MNEDCLQEYLNALWWNDEITEYALAWCIYEFLSFLWSKYYHPFALTRSEEQNSIVMMLLAGLAVVWFRIYLKPREMDEEDYWTTIKLMWNITILFILNSH